MPFTVRTFQSTPNPNALKVIVDRAITDRPKSYFAPADATDDTLAGALFAIPGVTNLLFNDDWVTVSKSPEFAWPPIRAAVERVLARD